MNGFDNEYNFVKEINNHKLKELNPLLYDLIIDLFGNINEESIIKCWKNHLKQKTDVFIKINNTLKGISIKLGSRNSVHTESVYSFIKHLEHIGISEESIKLFKKYHYGDFTLNNTGAQRLNSIEVRKYVNTDLINRELNNYNVIIDLIKRSVTLGLISKHEIDAIVIGTPNDFLYLLNNDIYRVLLKKSNFSNSIHISSLYIQPLSRNINFNKKYEHCREYVQFKWYSLFDDILWIKNENIKYSVNRSTDNVWF